MPVVDAGSGHKMAALAVSAMLGYDWTRITGFKHPSGERSPKTRICYEFPKEKGERYCIVMDDDNMAKPDRDWKDASLKNMARRYTIRRC